MPDPIGEFCGWHHDYHDILPRAGGCREGCYWSSRLASTAARSSTPAPTTCALPRDSSRGRPPHHRRQRRNAIAPFLRGRGRQADRRRPLLELRRSASPAGHRPRPPAPVLAPAAPALLARAGRGLHRGRPGAYLRRFGRASRVGRACSRTSSAARSRRSSTSRCTARCAATRPSSSRSGMHPRNAYLVVRRAQEPRGGARPRPVPWNESLRGALAGGSPCAPGSTRPRLPVAVAAPAAPAQAVAPPPVRGPAPPRRPRVGVPPHASHIRHRAPTRLPIELLQRELGHSRIEQTLRYAQLLDTDLVRGGEKVDADYTRSMNRLMGAA